ncbi:MAG TPA: hypothetical protein VKA67_06650 [Verrucomicrobiae bacterium]|nr:hypothetical protein [Verrucomicrobiae bacterium]
MTRTINPKLNANHRSPNTAARQHNLLWTLAATAGIAAIIFAIYVYLRV